MPPEVLFLDKQKGRLEIGPFTLFLLFFIHDDDFPALIMTAAWANGVGETHLTAVAASNELDGC
jgi:hypothetical protein